MDTLIPLLQVFGGLAVLVIGAEALVRGAVAAANALRVPPMVIGLTIVSFGTSAPELFIGIQASLQDYPALALGTVIGSNTANMLLVLGIAAVIHPIAVNDPLIRRDMPALLVASVLLLAFCYDGVLDRSEAGMFLLMVASYTFHIYMTARSGADKALAHELCEEATVRMPEWKAGLSVAVGLALLIAGSNTLISGSVALAGLLGASEAAIGLTVLAFGASLPELFTSVFAALRKQPDIALGNVIGSCLFNITCIGGAAAAVSPLAVDPHLLSLDIPVMLAATALLALFAFTGSKIVRLEGWVLLSGYMVYLVWLLLRELLAA